MDMISMKCKIMVILQEYKIVKDHTGSKQVTHC